VIAHLSLCEKNVSAIPFDPFIYKILGSATFSLPDKFTYSVHNEVFSNSEIEKESVQVSLKKRKMIRCAPFGRSAPALPVDFLGFCSFFKQQPRGSTQEKRRPSFTHNSTHLIVSHLTSQNCNL
jgi:hypothetical protein